MLASDCDLGEYLLMGKGEENSGGRTRVNNLCRGFEAVVGAVYMDSGLDAVKHFVSDRLGRLLEYILENDLHKDARSMLQERSQAELRFTPVYRVVDASGPDHEKEFFIEVVVGDIVIGSGTGTSKRAAAQAAARSALQRLEEVGWPEEAQVVFPLAERSNRDEDTSDDDNEVEEQAG
jgi:ribonuclease-3